MLSPVLKNKMMLKSNWFVSGCWGETPVAPQADLVQVEVLWPTSVSTVVFDGFKPAVCVCVLPVLTLKASSDVFGSSLSVKLYRHGNLGV